MSTELELVNVNQNLEKIHNLLDKRFTKEVATERAIAGDKEFQKTHVAVQKCCLVCNSFKFRGNVNCEAGWMEFYVDDTHLTFSCCHFELNKGWELA